MLVQLLLNSHSLSLRLLRHILQLLMTQGKMLHTENHHLHHHLQYSNYLSLNQLFQYTLTQIAIVMYLLFQPK